jgi:hypothetical protein
MRKKSHERPNRIVEINWVQRKLNRVIDKTATNLHHIMWRCNKHLYNVNIDENKIRMSEKEHIALNNYFWNKQNPREQLQKVYETVKTVLTPWVRRELYTILYDTDDSMFYIPELLKWKKKKKNGTNTEKLQKDADTD